MGDEDANAVLARAYAWLQLIVGLIALSVPFVLLAVDQTLRDSISAYYYGRAGSWFVGSLFALAVFFLSYEYPPRRGFKTDFWLGVAACPMAVAVALFPTKSEGADEVFVNWIHNGSAAVLFGIIAVFCFRFTFPRGQVQVRSTGEVLRRCVRTPPMETAALSRLDRVTVGFNRGAMFVIIGSFATTAALSLTIGRETWFFWLETAMVLAFSGSWLLRAIQQHRNLRTIRASTVRNGEGQTLVAAAARESAGPEVV